MTEAAGRGDSVDTTAPASTATDVGFTPLHGCWICESDSWRAYDKAVFEHEWLAERYPALAAYTGRSVRVMRCRTCGFGQPEALPSYSNYFDQMYEALNWPADWMEAEFRSQQKDLVIQTILDGLDRRIGTGDRTLLDVGASLGRFIQTAAQRGMQPEGLELNPTTAAFAERATGLPIRRASVHQVAIDGRRYGAVTMTDVLEHIPRPLAVLQKLHGLLKPDGWIAVKVPHGSAQFVKERLRTWIRPGYRGGVAGNLVHVNQFGVRSLRLALERVGFVDISVEIGAPELRPSAERWLRRTAGNAVSLGVWRMGRMIPGGVRSPLGLHLQAFARRP